MIESQGQKVYPGRMRRLLSFPRNLLSRDPDRRLFALKMIADRLLPDYRLSWHQMDWWQDKDFNAFLDRFGERRGFNTHRKWSLWQMLRLVAAVPGDTAECGVFEGASSWLICAANRNNPRHKRTHFLFDSFEGLSKPELIDGNYWTEGLLSAGEDRVLANLFPFADMLSFHKGWIPERFDDVKDRRFAFVHIDVDLAQPTADSLAFFYERMNPGGIILCDDYACSTCPGATVVIDEFLAHKPEKMIALDAGGGFLIKGNRTSVQLPAMATTALMDECPRCAA